MLPILPALPPEKRRHQYWCPSGEVVSQFAELSLNWSARFGGAGQKPWQRYNKTQGWVTIQSWNATCNGPGNICTGGSWIWDTATFPTSWGALYSHL